MLRASLILKGTYCIQKHKHKICNSVTKRKCIIKKLKLNTIRATNSPIAFTLSEIVFNDLHSISFSPHPQRVWNNYFPFSHKKIAYMKTLNQRSRDKDVIKKIYFFIWFHVHNSKLLHLPAIKKLKVNFSLSALK